MSLESPERIQEADLKKYTYRNNIDGGSVVFVCIAKNITEADEKYEKKTHINPSAQNYIGCSVEDLPTIYFKNTFFERLSQISDLDDEAAVNLASWYEDTGITSVKKEVPAVLFRSAYNNMGPLDSIWIENIKDINKDGLVHQQIRERLEETTGEDKIGHICGYVLVDGENKLHLIVDLLIGKYILEDKEIENKDYLDILEILKKYNIEDIIMKASERQLRIARRRGEVGFDPIAEAIVSKNMLEKRREDIFLVNMARKYNMTNNQYLRFRMLAESLYKSGTQVSLDELAESIVKDEDGTKIDVKGLPTE
ncbi:hypothetical protein IT397_01215 [Candidatus Nomurabacteria bacterium]|nr:hypothetical protein [Candidatus Nomurabacteria bacterium]